VPRRSPHALAKTGSTRRSRPYLRSLAPARGDRTPPARCLDSFYLPWVLVRGFDSRRLHFRKDLQKRGFCFLTTCGNRHFMRLGATDAAKTAAFIQSLGDRPAAWGLREKSRPQLPERPHIAASSITDRSDRPQKPRSAGAEVTRERQRARRTSGGGAHCSPVGRFRLMIVGELRTERHLRFTDPARAAARVRAPADWKYEPCLGQRSGMSPEARVCSSLP
jgi:hypothetical protein